MGNNRTHVEASGVLIVTSCTSYHAMLSTVRETTSAAPRDSTEQNEGLSSATEPCIWLLGAFDTHEICSIHLGADVYVRFLRPPLPLRPNAVYDWVSSTSYSPYVLLMMLRRVYKHMVWHTSSRVQLASYALHCILMVSGGISLVLPHLKPLLPLRENRAVLKSHKPFSIALHWL